MKRRSFIAAILGAAAAPAIVRAGILMPVKTIVPSGEFIVPPYYGTSIVEMVREAQAEETMRYIKHVASEAAYMPFGMAQLKEEGKPVFYDMRGAAHPDNVPLVEAGMISVLLPDQRLPPGWEYCDAQGNVRLPETVLEEQVVNQAFLNHDLAALERAAARQQFTRKPQRALSQNASFLEELAKRRGAPDLTKLLNMPYAGPLHTA